MQYLGKSKNMIMNNDHDYKQWKIMHEEGGKCEINHLRSSGAVEIFRHSVEKYGLIYNQYLGDGDSSSFTDVVNSNSYKEYNIIPEKLECVGHVQKRLGTRLRNKVKEHIRDNKGQIHLFLEREN